MVCMHSALRCIALQPHEERGEKATMNRCFVYPFRYNKSHDTKDWLRIKIGS